MTPLRHDCGTLYDLDNGQREQIGRDTYILRKRSRGGMGFILFLEFEGIKPPSRFVYCLRIALKSVLPTTLDAEATALFRREFVVWSGLLCGTIVGLNEILDAGKDGWVAAMNWYPGSLRDHITEIGIAALPDAIHIIHDVVNGLAYAYEKDGVLHLDLKPENILYVLDADRMTRHG